MKSSIKNFSSKSDQIRKKLRIWSHLMKKSLMQNFIFCTVLQLVYENLFHRGVIKYVAKTNNTMPKANYKCSRTMCEIFLPVNRKSTES